ncbi:MAG: hypothetical protein B6U65_04650 [Candidatus Wolframiiraptor sp. EX4484-121]|nr:MAG: hypothetical protein B6U65_04650 [Candidatus Wolframiiraptor sp. EX4484-121]
MRCLEILSEAELSLTFMDEREAEIIAKSLEPDNQPLPRGLKLKMTRAGKVILFEIRCERGVRSLLTTLDDILCMANLTLKAIRSLERSKHASSKPS